MLMFFHTQQIYWTLLETSSLFQLSDRSMNYNEASKYNKTTIWMTGSLLLSPKFPHKYNNTSCYLLLSQTANSERRQTTTNPKNMYSIVKYARLTWFLYNSSLLRSNFLLLKTLPFVFIESKSSQIAPCNEEREEAYGLLQFTVTKVVYG